MKNKDIKVFFAILMLSVCCMGGCSNKNDDYSTSESLQWMDFNESTEEGAQSASVDNQKNAESKYLYVGHQNQRLVFLDCENRIHVIDVKDLGKDANIYFVKENQGTVLFGVSTIVEDNQTQDSLYRLKEDDTYELVETYESNLKSNLIGFMGEDFYHFSYLNDYENGSSFLGGDCYEKAADFQKKEVSLPFYETVPLKVWPGELADSFEYFEKYGMTPVVKEDQSGIDFYNIQGEVVDTIEPVDKILAYSVVFGGRYLAFTAGDYSNNPDENTQKDYGYDRETGKLYDFSEIEENHIWDIHSIVGNQVYYTVGLNESNLLQKLAFKCYSFETGEVTTLFEAEKQPGVEFYSGSITSNENMKLVENKGYFLMDSVEGLSIYSINLDKNATPSRIGEPIEKNRKFEYGIVTPYYEAFVTEDRKDMYYEYYFEDFAFSKEYPGADVINRFIKEKIENRITSAKEAAGEYLELYQEDLEGGYGVANCFVENSVSDAYELGERYVAVEMTGYDYSGGAHGYPDWEQLVFDKNTGEQINFETLYQGSQEDFKTLVAEYTLKEYQKEMSGYFPMDSDEEAYQTFYENARIDMFSMLHENSLTIIYTPYEFGPYASGHLCVEIPYEKLGITL